MKIYNMLFQSDLNIHDTKNKMELEKLMNKMIKGKI